MKLYSGVTGHAEPSSESSHFSCYLLAMSCHGDCCLPSCHTDMQISVVINTLGPYKKGHFIFVYISGISRSIFVMPLLFESWMHTLQNNRKTANCFRRGVLLNRLFLTFAENCSTFVFSDSVYSVGKFFSSFSGKKLLHSHRFSS